MLPQTPNLLATNVMHDDIIPKTLMHQLNIQATYNKHKQYFESNYVEEYDEEEPEAYDVNLCIDDSQSNKRHRTQDYETGDYE